MARWSTAIEINFCTCKHAPYNVAVNDITDAM